MKFEVRCSSARETPFVYGCEDIYGVGAALGEDGERTPHI